MNDFLHWQIAHPVVVRALFLALVFHDGDGFLGFFGFLFALIREHQKLCTAFHDDRRLLGLASEQLLSQPAHLLYFLVLRIGMHELFDAY